MQVVWGSEDFNVTKHLFCLFFSNQALSKMKAEWKDIEFVFVQYKDTGISILSAVDDLQVRLHVSMLGESGEYLPRRLVNIHHYSPPLR